MAKVIITLEDGEEDGAVCVDLDFGEEVDLEVNGKEFRPPGVTHSAPLGRRSFLQIPPPLRVVS